LGAIADVAVARGAIADVAVARVAPWNEVKKSP